jgi:protein required for attachment to host cells
MKLWILIADEGRARVFARPAKSADLREVEGFIHSKSRLQNQQLVTDRPGRVRTGLRGHAATALSPHTDPERVEAGCFAAELADKLRQARECHEFDLLALVAPPRFLGLLRQELHEQTRRCVVACTDHELTSLPVEELPAHLRAVLHAADQTELAREN